MPGNNAEQTRRDSAISSFGPQPIKSPSHYAFLMIIEEA